jgi:hypothetical protein
MDDLGDRNHDMPNLTSTTEATWHTRVCLELALNIILLQVLLAINLIEKQLAILHSSKRKGDLTPSKSSFETLVACAIAPALLCDPLLTLPIYETAKL